MRGLILPLLAVPLLGAAQRFANQQLPASSAGLGPVGTLRGVEHFVVRNGKISRITLVWDPTTVREFQARQRAAAPGGAA